jgi:hypothetical protein
MQRIKNLIKSITKTHKVAVLAGLTAGLIAIPVVVFAGYGPNGGDRKIFDFSNPAEREGAYDAPRFNSYVNTNVYGDERAFLDAKECVVNGPECYSNGVSGGYRDNQPVTAGKEYIVRAYVHNIANPSTNASGVGVAKNTRLRVEIPAGQANGFTLNARITADNSIPKTVYDTVDLNNSATAFNVEYVPGSAYISNQSHPEGFKLGDDIVGGSGTLLGDDVMNGDFPGCFEFAAFVTIRVKVVAPKMTVTKRVTTPGSTEWRESLEAKKGDTVSWLINYDITDGPADDVTIRDTIPAGLKLVPGSITWFDPNRPSGQALPDTALGAGGVNVGNYSAGSGGAIRFRTTVERELDECVIKNVAYGRATNVPEQSDDARVVVEDCEPDVPVVSCDALSSVALGERRFRYTVAYTAQNATLKTISYDFGDDSDDLVTDKTTVEHTYAADGTYVTRATLTFTVDGEDQVVSGNNCVTTVSASTPKDNCPIPGKENLPKDSPECKETPDVPVTPVTPVAKTLPDTGAGSVAAIFLAVSAGATVAYNVVLRRSNG